MSKQPPTTALLSAVWRFALTCALLLGLAHGAAAASRTIAYQGFLSTPSGAPLNGDFALTFRIYRDAAGSERLWTERHASVPVRAGLFLVALGSIEPLDNAPELFAVGNSLFLSIEVARDGEMTPRLPLSVAPYSLAASATRSATRSVDCTQGETIAEALDLAPLGGTYTLNLIGTCVGNVVIARNNVTINGNGTAKIVGVTPNPHAGNAVVYIDGARSVLLNAVTIEGAAGDATGMRGILVDNGASAGLFDNGVVRNVNGYGLLVVDNSSFDLRGQVLDTDSHGVRIEGNSHIDLQDAVVDRPGPGAFGLNLRIHSSATMLRSTVRSVDYVAVLVDDASTLRINDDNLIESAIEPNVWATLAVYRGSAVRVHGSNSVIRNTNTINYTESGAFSSAAGGQAMDVEMKSAFRSFDNPLTIVGWIGTYNLSTIDIRHATINGHLQPSGLRSNIRLRDNSGEPGRVTLNGNVRLSGGAFSIRTDATAAIINGNVDCRNRYGVSSNIQFQDPDDGYINCSQFESDLAVAFTNSTDPAVVGQTATYTAEIFNETLSPAVEAVNASASFSLRGAAATIIDATGPAGSCSFTPTTANCFLGRVRTGSPATISLNVRRDAPGAIIKEVTVGAQNSDPDPSDNTLAVGGGTITGTVTDEGTGLGASNVSVQIYDAGGNFVTSVNTDASGNYTTSAGLVAGSYFARTFNSAGLIDALYDGVACAGGSCNITSGTPITVTVGATTAGIDFALERGGTIAGRVTDESTGLGAQSVNVQIYDTGGNVVTSVPTDANGNYTTTTGLAAGNYFARTFNFGNTGLVDELYDDTPCGSCPFTSATPITVTAGATTAGIDFALERGGTIAGRVTDESTGLGAPNITVQIFDAVGNFVTNANTDASGNYATSAGLPAGSYFAYTSDFQGSGLIDEQYNDVTCAGPCNVNVTSATPITVTVGATTSGIDFALELGGTIAGTVTDTGTGLGVPNTTVQISDAVGSFVTNVNTDASGNYTTGGLAAGNYFARTFNSAGLIDELYDDIACGSCIITSGTPITVTVGATTSGIDFALD